MRRSARAPRVPRVPRSPIGIGRPELYTNARGETVMSLRVFKSRPYPSVCAAVGLRLRETVEEDEAPRAKSTTAKGFKFEEKRRPRPEDLKLRPRERRRPEPAERPRRKVRTPR